MGRETTKYISSLKLCKNVINRLKRPWEDYVFKFNQEKRSFYPIKQILSNNLIMGSFSSSCTHMEPNAFKVKYIFRSKYPRQILSSREKSFKILKITKAVGRIVQVACHLRVFLIIPKLRMKHISINSRLKTSRNLDLLKITKKFKL